MAPTIPRRVRKRWAAGIMNNSATASMMKSTCRSNADGGTFMDCGGGMNAVAVICPVAVVPGAGAAAVVGTAHAESNVPGVQVKDTDPLNPPNPVMITGNVPLMPLVTPMVATETEKSHVGPLSGTVATLPSVCVIVSEPETGPGGVAATGLKVTLMSASGPFGSDYDWEVAAIASDSVSRGCLVEISGAAAIDAETERRVAVVANRDVASRRRRQQSTRQSETGGCDSDVPRGAAASAGERYLHRMGRTIQSIQDLQCSVPSGSCGRRRKDHPDRAARLRLRAAWRTAWCRSLLPQSPQRFRRARWRKCQARWAFAVLLVIVTNCGCDGVAISCVPNGEDGGRNRDGRCQRVVLPRTRSSRAAAPRAV